MCVGSEFTLKQARKRSPKTATKTILINCIEEGVEFRVMWPRIKDYDKKKGRGKPLHWFWARAECSWPPNVLRDTPTNTEYNCRITSWRGSLRKGTGRPAGPRYNRRGGSCRLVGGWLLGLISSDRLRDLVIQVGQLVALVQGVDRWLGPKRVGLNLTSWPWGPVAKARQLDSARQMMNWADNWAQGGWTLEP